MNSSTDTAKPTTELGRPSWEKRKWPMVVVLVLIVIACLAALSYFFKWFPFSQKEEAPTATVAIKPEARMTLKPKETGQVIAYDQEKKKVEALSRDVIEERKKMFGLKKSVDIVAKSGESIKIGDQVIPIKEILEQIREQETGLSPTAQAFLEKPEILERNIVDPKKSAPSRFQQARVKSEPSEPQQARAKPEPSKPEQARVKPDQTSTDSINVSAALGRNGMSKKQAVRPVHYFGIYIVRPGDNLWNIHFEFLKEYFNFKNVQLTADDDEPKEGKSSGIGRILKFAENMVYIFNIKTRVVSRDLDTLSPHEKIIVFNLTHVYNILGPIEETQLKVIRFDGRDLIIPEQ